MTDLTVQSLSVQDYDQIEQAVMETARGRWFLAEFARRNRQADTLAVLDAVGRLEARMAAQPRDNPAVARIQMDLMAMAEAIARTKSEIAAIRPDGEEGRFAEASNELDAIVMATETATGEILGAAETIQEIAWTLREMGTEAEVCDMIDVKATEIYTACSFQDVTGQRTRKVIGVLGFLEERIDGMMKAWGRNAAVPSPEANPPARPDAGLLNGPAAPGEGLHQDDVDLMMQDGLDMAVKAEPPPTPATVRAMPSVRGAAIAMPAGLPSLEDIERLSFVEKAALMA